MPYTTGTEQYNDTLAGALRINDANLSDVEYSEIIQPTEFMKILPFVPASRGTQHSWTVETVAPSAKFRDIGEGILNTAGKGKTITANLKLIDATMHKDKGLKGTLGPRVSWDEYIAKEAMKSLNSTLVNFEKQLILGTGGHLAGGFDGLSDILDIWGTMGEDLGGVGGTRVYMLCLGKDNIAGVLGSEQAGKEGNIDMSDPFDAPYFTDGTGKSYPATWVSILGWGGLQIAGAYSGAVAFNIDGTTGKTVDEDLLAGLYTKFPSQYRQNINCILMSGTGLKQLRDSMVTDLIPSPVFPTNWGGAGRPIPIVVSDAIDDDEDKNEESS